MRRGTDGYIPAIKKCKNLIQADEELSGHKYEYPRRSSGWFLSLLGLLYASLAEIWYLRGHGKFNKTSGRINARVSQIVLKSITVVRSESRRRALLTILKEFLDERQMYLVSEALPDVFYSDPVKLLDALTRGQKVVHCSPTVFQNFDGYEYLLLLQTKIRVFGYQHGGGYWLRRDLCRDHELKLSDQYFFWGFARINSRQIRYKPKNILLPPHAKNVIWIERANMSPIYRYLQPDFWHESLDASAITYIDSELSKIAMKAQRKPHLMRRSTMYRSCSVPSIEDPISTELLIDESSLVIFDHVCHSLIFYCIENSIRFICAIDLNRYRHIYKKRFIEYLEARNSLIDISTTALATRISTLLIPAANETTAY